ncbi:MAG: DUF359 domain-containing protein [Thermoplasmata archaeon]|jgi:hypothetical protein|nr:DUF359 domain-containing protein [Thermoplasmata archaeon]MVT12799.1 DUF359 domain-containing protein [Euryarchaeota archaeon]MVT15307.1 DUF359 domain-containing protein [Euryarchaeota archaeon]MVT35457.1 DUF359 domain-containing protein [Euryarchaeota archaeon]
MQLKQGERLRLPDYLRDELSKPVGKVLSGNELSKMVEDETKLICVGDETTETVIHLGIKPKLSIFDLKSRRIRFHEKLLNVFKHRIIVKNPPGYITYDLFRSIKYSLENSVPAIQVVGEEDLASLVCIFYAQLGVTIIYGIPNMGLALIKVDENIKKRTEEIFEKMVIEDGA